MNNIIVYTRMQYMLVSFILHAMFLFLSRHVSPTLGLWGLEIHVYGLLIGLAIFLGWLLISQRSIYYRISEAYLDQLFLWCVLAGIVGARLYHVIDLWEYYWLHWREIMMIWNGGLGIFGALLGGFVALFYVSKKEKLSLMSVLNLVSPTVLLGQAIGRWGNFFNHEAFGPPTDLPWKIFIPLENRPLFWQTYEYFHPVFLYESLLCILGVGILFYWEKRSRYTAPLVAGYLVIYGMIRLVTEQFRYDTAVSGGIPWASVISIVMILGGVLWGYLNFRKTV